MANQTKTFLSSVWFNSKLLVKNGIPLKFYLDGYEPGEFQDMVRIIEAYGGQLSKCEEPGTFIFCEPRRPTFVKGDHYNIKYFYDCIVAHEPQELEKYKLQSSTDPRNDKENANSTSCYFTTSETQEDSIWSEVEEANTSLNTSKNYEAPRRMTRAYAYEIRRTADHNLSLSTFTATNPEENTKQVADQDHNSDSEESFKDETVGDVLMKSSQSEAESEESDEPRGGLRRSFGGRRKRKRGPKSYVFSELDNQIIVDWLIKKNVILKAGGRRVWQNFLAENILKNFPHGYPALQRHFKEYVRFNFEKYTNDPKAINDFEKMRKIKVFQPAILAARYSEEESRCMIEYLIDHKVIHRAFTLNVWTDCLEENPILRENSRTDVGLKTRFKASLVHKYRNYTSDPKAIREFEKLLAKLK